jgi:dolichyl-phosphate beta-glucosyltransferase
MDLSVILPAYNEEKNIIGTLTELDNFLKDQFLNYEIIIVDDGSSDKSNSLIKSFNGGSCILLENPQNLGKGAAVKRGMLSAKGDLILFMDADNSTTIANLPDFIKAIGNNDFDIVIASRALSESDIKLHQPKFKEYLGKMGNLLIRLLLVPRISDTQCGFKLFKKECLKLFKLQRLSRWGFDFEILFLAKKFNFKIKEMPVSWTNNFDTKVRSSDYLGTLKELILVLYNNLTGKYKYDNHSQLQ